MADYHLNNLYDTYAAAVYGMICRCVEKEELAEKVLQALFIRLYEENFTEDPGFFKIMTLARQVICIYIEHNREQFIDAKFDDCTCINNDYIFQLVCFGRYTIQQLGQMLNIEESLVKQRLHLGMQEFMQNCRPLAPAVI